LRGKEDKIAAEKDFLIEKEENKAAQKRKLKGIEIKIALKEIKIGMSIKK
jgi:hypothetical protein